MKKIKKIGIILFICLLISSPALATDWQDWNINPPDGYALDKIWTIEFNQQLELSQSNIDSIFIKDNLGNTIETEKNLKTNTSITIKPIKNYQANTTYTLYVDDTMESLEGKILKNPIKMNFQTKEVNLLEQFKTDIAIALRNGETNIDISNYKIQSNHISDIVSDIVINDPLILYYNGFSYSYNTDTNLITEFRPKYKIDSDLIKDKLEAVETEGNRIFNEVLNLNNKTDYEKILEIHDYLAQNIVYDIEGFNSENIDPDQHSMYGALVENLAVCEGYSESLLYFLNKLNIESKQIVGDANGGPHSWNLVKLDGNWYHIDVTFDDPVPDGGDIIRHKYFLTTDDLIGTNHTWIKSDYEPATKTDYYYFVKENLTVTSKAEFKSKIKELYQNNTSKMEIWCNPFDSNIYTVELIAQSLKEAGNTQSFTYSIDDKTGIVKITTK